MATDVKKIINDYISAMNSHDVNKAISLWADNGVYENLGTESVIHGKKELTDMLSASFVDIPDAKYELKSVFGANDWACTEWVLSGTHAHSSLSKIPATGKTFSVRMASIVQFSKGKIIRQSDYWNVATMLQQVGLMPGQPK